MSRQRHNSLSQHQLAEKWGCSQPQIGKLTEKGCDFDAPDDVVANWLLKNCKRKPAKMKAAIEEVLKLERVSVEGVEQKSLEEMAEYYSRQLNAATSAERVDREDVKFWNDLLLKTDESIRRSEAHAKKLGVDKGELLSRGEVERILRAVAWAGNACCDKFSKQIAQRLSDKKPAEVHRILKPTLTALTLFEAMKRVAKTPGDVNLPEWCVECFATEEKQYVKGKE